MTLPRWLGPGAVAFVAVWVVLLAGGRGGMLRDPGTFWHTTTGERLMHDGFFDHDPYTFTFGGSWWVPHQWLGEVGMALTHRVAGFDAQLLAAVTLLAAVFALLAARLARTGLHPVAVGAVLALALAAAGSHFHVRPHLVTIAGMAVTAVLLAGADSGRIRLRALFWLSPLFVLWANVHGGFLGGFGTVVIAAGGWVVFWRLGRPSPVESWRHVGLLALLIVACAAAPLLNPYGLDMLRAWKTILGEPILKEIIKEHRPLDVAESYAWPILGFAAVYVFVLAGLSRREVRVSWLLPLPWLLQSFERCRHAPLFVVVAFAVLTAMWPHTRWAQRLAKTRPDFYQPGAPVSRPWWASVWLPVIAVLVVLALQVGRVAVPVFGAGWARHDPRHWPVELLDTLKEHEPKPGEPDRLFNDYSDGGFVIYHAPGYRVFVDDRCEVFGGEWLREFVVAAQHDTGAAVARWELRYGRFAFALTRTNTAFDEHFKSDPDWRCVKRTATAAFYRRG